MTKKKKKGGRSYVVFAFLAIISLTFPVIPAPNALALTNADLQARIQALIQQIQTLQEKIQAFRERERERRLALLPSQSLPRLN